MDISNYYSSIHLWQFLVHVFWDSVVRCTHSYYYLFLLDQPFLFCNKMPFFISSYSCCLKVYFVWSFSITTSNLFWFLFEQYVFFLSFYFLPMCVFKSTVCLLQPTQSQIGFLPTLPTSTFKLEYLSHLHLVELLNRQE